ncbi:MAG: hypothetical protein EP344_11105 [Bacteroidetes bacterium]|nr:MAG: hypothetical protein EP344_11105 [Bacteroidota bacterium]
MRFAPFYIVCTTCILLLWTGCSQNPEPGDWSKAVAANSIEAYSAYLAKYPDSEKRDSIGRQLDRLRLKAAYGKFISPGDVTGIQTPLLLFRPENLGYDHPLQGFPLILCRLGDSSLAVVDCFRAGNLKNMDQSKGIELVVASDLEPFEIAPEAMYRLTGFWAQKNPDMMPDSLASLVSLQRKAMLDLFESGQDPTEQQWAEFYSAILAERLEEQPVEDIQVGWLMTNPKQSIFKTVAGLGTGIVPRKIFVVQGVEYLE